MDGRSVRAFVQQNPHVADADGGVRKAQEAIAALAVRDRAARERVPGLRVLWVERELVHQCLIGQSVLDSELRGEGLCPHDAQRVDRLLLAEVNSNPLR